MYLKNIGTHGSCCISYIYCSLAMQYCRRELLYYYDVCMFGHSPHTYSKSMDQPGKVANPARGQLNRENEYSPVRVRA